MNEKPKSPEEVRKSLGEAHAYCSGCNIILFSFDGKEDIIKSCPHPEKCRWENKK